MIIGDRVKFKINNIWLEGTIVNVHEIPDEWCLVDIESDIGKIYYNISSREVYGF